MLPSGHSGALKRKTFFSRVGGFFSLGTADKTNTIATVVSFSDEETPSGEYSFQHFIDLSQQFRGSFPRLGIKLNERGVHTVWSSHSGNEGESLFPFHNNFANYPVCLLEVLP
ncbi:hypothetical protein CDAR_283991 [Caerostris darwini]|uniref:Uncharacterized protein n=1 Tax=Caerostris darwini TaxID=1538125 RepID=A0AAV4PPI7_9ARAC|nr:hypothetical protein CDAR_283991 [Caerostris darwini]